MALPHSILIYTPDKKSFQETEQTRNSINGNQSTKLREHKARDLVPVSPKAILAKRI